MYADLGNVWRKKKGILKNLATARGFGNDLIAIKEIHLFELNMFQSEEFGATLLLDLTSSRIKIVIKRKNDKICFETCTASQVIVAFFNAALF